ncbi:hypothetical protein COV16_05005 [Candidatus Woesearchaeota archaeon CG10_big_fil_rev_8_21_14_0_10_34_8]|nr:MAG: hypothetical protein COV16_05005 [Candidatus Woesearchaeota archaeon CG10_big_fil_rev_8_21_14_0_10_34_8]
MGVIPDLEERLEELFDAAVSEIFTTRFHNMDRIGQGGFGILYYAEDGDGNPRAVKVYAIPKVGNQKVDVVVDQRGLKAIKRAEMFADKVRHRNVVHIFGSGTINLYDENVHWVEMEFVPREEGSNQPGLTLESYTNEYSPLKLTEFREIAHPIADGVAELHKLGIVHLDLKPSNILLDETRDNRPVVIDFNIAQKVDKHGMALEQSVGIPSSTIAAPEAEETGELSLRTDIYALGVVFEQLLGERTPLRYSHVIRKCKHSNPNKRYKNAGSLRRGLRIAQHFGKIIGTTAVAVLALAYLGYTNFNHQLAIEKENECVALVDSNPALAEKSCLVALSLEENRSRAYLYLGHSLLEQGRMEEAREAYHAVQYLAGQKQTLPEEVKRKALEFESEERVDLAIATLEMIIQDKPGNSQKHYPKLAELFLKQQRYEDAGKVLDKIVRYEDQYPEQFAEVSQYYFKQKAWIRAERFAKDAIKTRRRQLGLNAEHKHNTKEIPNNTEEIPRNETQLADYHFLLGDILFAQAKYDEGFDEYYQGNCIKPDRPDVFMKIGQMWLNQDKYSAAEEVARRAATLYEADLANARVERITYNEKLQRTNEEDIAFNIYSIQTKLLEVYVLQKDTQIAQGESIEDIQAKIRRIFREIQAYEAAQ